MKRFLKMKQAKLDLTRLVPVESLKEYERNARVHSEEQLAQIEASIKEYGFTIPVLADLENGGVVVAGHGRLRAMASLQDQGVTVSLPNGDELPAGTVPVIDCSGWPEAKRRAYTLIDNRIAENSEWDESLLSQELSDLFLDFGGDQEAFIGFSDDELAFAVNGAVEDFQAEADHSAPSGDLLTVKVGDTKVPVSDAELSRLSDAIDGHVETNGALFGFFADLMDRAGVDA